MVRAAVGAASLSVTIAPSALLETNSVSAPSRRNCAASAASQRTGWSNSSTTASRPSPEAPAKRARTRSGGVIEPAGSTP